ncbi:MAG: AAA family ATPase [Planctomycetaceae bacterium]|nr:AAA family ATPase [Planctomycetaceae bacterium]
MKLSVSYDFLPKQQTTLTTQIMDCFGVDFETGQHVIAKDFDVPIADGQIVCFTGESGSGKSSLMRQATRQLKRILDIDQIDLGTSPLVDALNLPVQEGLQLLSACGLSEAQLMLRTPAELSDGQRYRFRLALAISKKPSWIIADEFTATLDRTLAKVVAFNLRKLCDRMGIGFLIATTHEDILEDLGPDLHIRCALGQPPKLSVCESDEDNESVKKKTHQFCRQSLD